MTALQASCGILADMHAHRSRSGIGCLVQAVAGTTIAALRWLGAREHTFIFWDEASRTYQPTPFGKAVLASGLPPEQCLVLKVGVRYEDVCAVQGGLPDGARCCASQLSIPSGMQLHAGRGKYACQRRACLGPPATPVSSSW
jgi:hypothetical protein